MGVCVVHGAKGGLLPENDTTHRKWVLGMFTSSLCGTEVTKG